MSYILDALKKSEKERQKGTLPDVLTVQDIVAEKPGKRLFWVYLLLGFLVLNAGVFVWWLGFSYTDRSKGVQAPTVDNGVPLSANDTAKEVADRVNPFTEPAQSSRPGLRSVDKNSAKISENTASTTSDNNSLPSKGIQKVPDVRRKILPNHPVSAKNAIKPDELSSAKLKLAEKAGVLSSELTGGLADTIDENKIYKVKELPLSIRQNLPLFSISALLYSSNPASRMVRINDQMMYEGQDLTAGLKLEEIAKDGVIFRHQKCRFWVGLK